MLNSSPVGGTVASFSNSGLPAHRPGQLLEFLSRDLCACLFCIPIYRTMSTFNHSGPGVPHVLSCALGYSVNGTSSCSLRRLMVDLRLFNVWVVFRVCSIHSSFGEQLGGSQRFLRYMRLYRCVHVFLCAWETVSKGGTLLSGGFTVCVLLIPWMPCAYMPFREVVSVDFSLHLYQHCALELDDLSM